MCAAAARPAATTMASASSKTAREREEPLAVAAWRTTPVAGMAFSAADFLAPPPLLPDLPASLPWDAFEPLEPLEPLEPPGTTAELPKPFSLRIGDTAPVDGA